MAVESKLSEKIPAPSVGKYPYIGVGKDGNGDAILFTAPESGVWLSGNMFSVGYSFDDWSEDAFSPLSPSESITLRNV